MSVAGNAPGSFSLHAHHTNRSPPRPISRQASRPRCLEFRSAHLRRHQTADTKASLQITQAGGCNSRKIEEDRTFSSFFPGFPELVLPRGGERAWVAPGHPQPPTALAGPLSEFGGADGLIVSDQSSPLRSGQSAHECRSGKFIPKCQMRPALPPAKTTVAHDCRGD